MFFSTKRVCGKVSLLKTELKHLVLSSLDEHRVWQVDVVGSVDSLDSTVKGPPEELFPHLRKPFIYLIF